MLTKLLSSVAEVEIPLSLSKSIQAKYLPSLVNFLRAEGKNVVMPFDSTQRSMIFERQNYTNKWKNRDAQAQQVGVFVDDINVCKVKNVYMNKPIYFGIEKNDLFKQASQSQSDLYYKKVEGIFFVHMRWQKNYSEWEDFDLLVYGRIPVDECKLYRYVYKQNQGKYDLLFIAAGSYNLPLSKEETVLNQSGKAVSFIFNDVEELPYRYCNLFCKLPLSEGVYAVHDIIYGVEDYNKDNPLHLGRWGENNSAVTAQGKKIHVIEGDLFFAKRQRNNKKNLEYKPICKVHSVKDYEEQASDICAMMDLLKFGYFKMK